MKLKALIHQANSTYDLNLNDRSTAELFNRMRMAGYGTAVTAVKAAEAIDTILALSDQLPRKAVKKPHSIYANLKREVAAAPDETACDRCQEPTQEVELVGGRKATYCKPCTITLPVKVQ